MKNKKPRVLFTVADQNNIKYANQMVKSLRKFHSEEELPVVIFTEKDIRNKEDWYRQKPLFAKKLISEYELVIGADADQIVTGKLDYIFNQEYDVGTVLNFNRVDTKTYGPVTVFNIPPQAYMNCGLVAMRSEKFINHWLRLCESPAFHSFQFREQDLLNIIIHYGDYQVECFDFPNNIEKYHAWHGLVSKGEYLKMIMKNGNLVLPKSSDRYPEHDKEIKILHSAGGGNEKKINDSYKIYFTEEVISYIESLIK